MRLATPGIASAFLLVAINSLADFGNPMLVGGNYQVLATEAYTQVTGAWDLPMGATLSVFLVIPTLIVFFIQRYYLERILRNRYGETCRRADPRHHGAACKMASLCILHAAQPRDLNDHRSRIPLCLYRCIRV